MLSKLTESLFFPILLLVTVFTNAQVKPMPADARLKSMQQRQVLIKIGIQNDPKRIDR